MDDFALVALLKDYAKKKDIYNGTRLHDDIIRKGLLHKSAYIASSLISMYAKCGLLGKAQQVLEELPIRDMISWSALISGYAQQGQGHKALICFEKMRREGFRPDVVTFTCILNACGRIGAIDKGKKIHEDLARHGLLRNHMVLGTALVDMYAKCGELEKAQEALEMLSVRDVVSWNALIGGYTQLEQGHKAFSCLDRIRIEGLSPDSVTFICILKACGSTKELRKGKQIHNEIISKMLMVECVVLGNALVDMYAKCGTLSKARNVLDDLHIRDVISWNALIAGYVQQGQGHEALVSFEQMKSEGLQPTTVTFICILKACGSLGAINKGEEIHEKVANMGLLEKDIVLGTALVDMYSKCGVVEKAQKVLDELPHRDIISWNALITAYSQQDRGPEALNCFARMQSEGLFPDMVTYLSILRACMGTGKGKQIHNEIINRGFLGEKYIALGNALVDMYANYGCLKPAQEVLDGLLIRDSVSWNALIAAYAQQGQWHEALNYYEHMQSEGLFPDAITYICILKTCGNIGAIVKGRQIHDEIMNKGWLDKDIILGNALVDMYAKCGLLTKAQEVLECLPFRDIVSWNALIAGYAEEGQGHEALDCFIRMRTDGVCPDDVTFLCVLSACSHSGLVHDAQALYRSMVREYRITPSIGHHTCMMVVFGCAGYFEKAASIIQAMPSIDYPGVWLALLGACRKWGNMKLGRLAFDQAIQLDCTCTAAYILMANIFSTAGLCEDAEKIELMRIEYATSKKCKSRDLVSTSRNVDLVLMLDGEDSPEEDMYLRIDAITIRMFQKCILPSIERG